MLLTNIKIRKENQAYVSKACAKIRFLEMKQATKDVTRIAEIFNNNLLFFLDTSPSGVCTKCSLGLKHNAVTSFLNSHYYFISSSEIHMIF